MRRLSFTERRRARLALKFDRLDPLEEKKTITEPISVSGLAFSLPLAVLQAGLAGAKTGSTRAARRKGDIIDIG